MTECELVTADETYHGVALTGVAADGKVLVRWGVGTDSRVLATRLIVLEHGWTWAL
jgi:hypothetical protein